MNHLSLNLVAPIALVAVLGVLALRLFLKTIKIGLLLAAPVLIYVLYQH